MSDTPNDHDLPPARPDAASSTPVENAAPAPADVPAGQSAARATLPADSAAVPNGISGDAAKPAGGAAAKTGGRKKRRVPLILKAIGILLLLPVVALLALVVVALVVRTDPLDALPPGFNAYVRVQSASTFFQQVIDLEIADAVLASPDFAPARVAFRAARSQDALRSELFRKIADIRCDAALYGASSVVAVADLGIRSALTRLAPFVVPLVHVEGLSAESVDGVTVIAYKKDNSAIYAGVRNNLVIASTDRKLLVKAMRTTEKLPKETRDALGAPGGKDLRVMVDPRVFADAFAAGAGSGSPVARLVRAVDFPALAVADASATNDAISLEVRIPLTVHDVKLEPVLERDSKTPAVLSVLPESTQYASILSAGRVSELKEAVFPYLGSDVKGDQLWKTADDAAKTALGVGLDELLFSWTGDEAGVFGVEGRAQPVYFIEVGDERKRKDVFEKAFNSFALATDDTTLVDGNRVLRMDFPWYIKSILEVAGVAAPRPYFAAERGFLFASESLDALSDVVKAARSGALLARTERWKTVSKNVSGASSASIYYSLDRSVPFFLRGSGAVTQALARYGRGYATVRVENGELVLSLSAVAAGGKGVGALPGFPLKAGGRLSPVVVARQQPGAPTARLLWIERGSTLVSYDPSSGDRREAELDADVLIATGDYDGLWAVSKRGTVYRSDARLDAAQGFPLVTGEAPSSAPLAVGALLYVPLSDGSLLEVAEDGTTRKSATAFDSPLLSPPVARKGLVAAYPKSFDGAVYLLGADGAVAEGWPQTVDGIGFGSPLLGAVGGHEAVGFLTQAGTLSLWATTGETLGDFPIALDGAFTAQALVSGGSVFALSERGVVHRVSGNADVATLELKGLSAKTGRVAAFDANRDGAEELFLTGDGNALFALTSDLRPLEGFPLAGSGVVAFADLNADGRAELVATTVDDTIAAYILK